MTDARPAGQNAGMTQTPPPPQGCSPALSDWPWPADANGLSLHRCQFDPTWLDGNDFARLGISAIPGAAKRQMEYLAGRYCAAAALRSFDCLAVPERGADRAPLWPVGFCGSISHSHGVALAVVGRQSAWRSLGLDLEAQLSDERARRLCAEILTPAEQQRLQSLPGDAQATRVSLTFSLKESLFKALYPLTGVRFYFQDAELLMADQGMAQLRLLKSLSAEWTAGRELPARHAEIDGQLLSLVAVAAE